MMRHMRHDVHTMNRRIPVSVLADLHPQLRAGLFVGLAYLCWSVG